VVREHFLSYSPGEQYDGIVIMGVTEHLPDYAATLQKFGELLKPGGRVYLDALAMRRKLYLSTFFKNYIYPGASAPLVLHRYLKQVNRTPFELLLVLDDRHNYYLTCRLTRPGHATHRAGSFAGGLRSAVGHMAESVDESGVRHGAAPHVMELTIGQQKERAA
jgi:hypothetical protein